MSPRASTPMRPVPGYRAYMVSRGEFLVDTPEPSVRCGICLEDFRWPHNKAHHLMTVHGARVDRRIDAEGNQLYTWRLP